MQFGLSTFFFPNEPVLAVIEKIVHQGIGVIECTYDLPQVDEMDGPFLAAVKKLQHSGVSFSLHGPLFEVNIGSLFPELRTFSKDRYRKAIDFAGEWGFDPVVVHPGYSLLTDRAKAISEKARIGFLHDLLDLQEYAQARSVRLALENIYMPYFFFYDLSEFGNLTQAIPGLGMTLDVGHAYLTKIQKGEKDPEGSILQNLAAIGSSSLFHVHLHNNLGMKDDHLLDQGRIDLPRIVRGLKDLGYKGKVILETYATGEHDLGQFTDSLKGISTS
jgi:sugar phosphate isomerase/epimerase